MPRSLTTQSETTNPQATTLQQHQQVDLLRRANEHLARQLAQAKHNTDELVAAVYRAVRDAASGLSIPPVEPPDVDRRRKPNEVAIAMVSDWQLGKRTPTYSSAICESRVMAYANKVLELTEIQRADHPVKECHVYLLGDLVESEQIFPGQAHRIDASLYQQMVVDGPRILSSLLRTLLSGFEKVHVVGVIGNHGAIAGRSRKETHPETNADFMLYTIVRDLLANEKRLTWNLPLTKGERSWYAIDRIGDYSMMLFHGDQMRGGGFGGLPHYGFSRAISNWGSGVIEQEFQGAACGHWHQAASLPFNHRVLWINGSTESGNEWLREELKVQCPPSQWLLFCHPVKGRITAEMRVWL